MWMEESKKLKEADKRHRPEQHRQKVATKNRKAFFNSRLTEEQFKKSKGQLEKTEGRFEIVVEELEKWLEVKQTGCQNDKKENQEQI